MLIDFWIDHSDYTSVKFSYNINIFNQNIVWKVRPQNVHWNNCKEYDIMWLEGWIAIACYRSIVIYMYVT